jgi:hypothetical protein
MRHLLLLGLLAAAPASADMRLALGPGETLTYRVSWGIFLHAGDIKVTTKAETDDQQPCLLVVTTTSTRGFLRSLFRFDARADSVFNLRTGRMVIHTEKSSSRKKPTDTMLTFDYEHRTADYRDLVQPGKDQIVPLPPGDPMDLITSLIQARAWQLKPGDKIDILVMFEEEPYELTFHAERYEEVSTSLGKFNTLVVVPRMEKTAPKGMFKRGSTVRVWISQDERHLPVKFEVEFKFGAGVATLVDYTPPLAPNANPGP